MRSASCSGYALANDASASATHEFEHRVAPQTGAIGEAARVVAFGAFEQSGQHGGFGHTHVAHGLAEVALRRGFDAVRPVPQVHLIQVELKDLVLGIPLFDGASHAGFLDLAQQRLLARNAIGEDIAGQLHRDRGEALRVPAGFHIARERTEHAEVVDPRVRIEAAVFGDDDRVAHVLGNVLQAHQGATLEPEFRDEPAVGGVHFGGLAGDILLERGDRWAAPIAADDAPRAKQPAGTEHAAEDPNHEQPPQPRAPRKNGGESHRMSEGYPLARGRAKSRTGDTL